MSASARQFGAWSALFAATASIAYAVPQVLQVAGLLSEPWDRILIFAPSLALAPAFVCTMAAAHECAPIEHRVWSRAALAFATIYAVLVSIVYINQLGVVIPRDISNRAASIAPFACCGFQMPMTVIDLLGYTYMSAATLMLAPVYSGMKEFGALRLALIGDAALAPIILGQLFWPWLIYPAATWLFTFPIAMILLASMFRRAATSPVAMM